MIIDFINPFNTSQLKRYPETHNKSLQAWDAADSYCLDYLFEEKDNLKDSKILIVNDAFGALSVALSEYRPQLISDSYLSKSAIANNLTLNKIDTNQVEFISDIKNSSKTCDYIVIKTPKIIDYLEFLFDELKPLLNKETKIIIAGMVKNMPKSLWKILDNNFNSCTTLLTKKKAKLIIASQKRTHPNKKYPISYKLENSDLSIYSYPNVFSKHSLDIGTRFLLQNLPNFNTIHSAIDLGCGNGVIGLSLAKKYPSLKIVFTDESYMAIQSAKLTCTKNLDSLDNLSFHVTDCLLGLNENAYSLIVCNPPFHQSHTIGINIALTMFKQAYKKLKTGGKLVVVANRHLPYYSHLEKLFKKVKLIASNSKFNLFLLKKN